MNHTRRTVIAALFAALTCVTTMVVKIPTPAMGYIHPGDGMVLLCGILLGPGLGGLAAGIGSMLADVLSGYASYAVGTLAIKALSAAAAGLLYRMLGSSGHVRVTLGGLAGESIMVGGYYLYTLGLTMLSGSGLAAAAVAAAGSVPFNLVQGAAGVLISLALLPMLQRVPTFHTWLQKTA